VRVESSHGRAPSRTVLAASIGFLVAVWAFNFIAGKIALRSLEPLTLASFRVVLAALAAVIVYLCGRRLPAFAGSAAAQKERRSWRDFWAFTYLGFFGVAINQVCFTVGLHYTSVSHSAVILGMGPIYTLLLAVLLRLERVTWRKAIGMSVAFVGITLMAVGNGLSTRSPSLLGDAITMTGAIGFAAYAVLGKRVASRYDALTMTMYNFLIGGLMILPLAIYRAWTFGSVAAWRAVPWQAWAAMLYMAVLSSAMAYAFYFWLLRYLEASQLSAFTYLLPITATLLGIVWLGERGSWSQILGGAIALAGVYWVESARGQ
jgi:drug/metabolite transporter (DMT)-like permease